MISRLRRDGNKALLRARESVLTQGSVQSEVGAGWAIVIDIGKTMSKVSLWSRDGQLLDRQVRPNAKCEEGGIARLDAAGIADWAKGVLTGHAKSAANDRAGGPWRGLCRDRQWCLAFPPSIMRPPRPKPWRPIAPPDLLSRKPDRPPCHRA
jgi:hypothetical protein